MAALTFLIAFWRVHFGVDLTDESFYVATAYRFVSGARPFIDELLVHQTGSWFLAIPVRAFLLFKNNNWEGIVLFTRYLYFIFRLFLCFFIFKTLRKFLNPGLSLLIALTCVAFVLFNIPNFSYNTLAWGFLTLGFFLGLLFVKEPGLLWHLFFSGLCLSLATVSYPTLLFIGFTYPWFLTLLIRQKKTFFVYYLGFLPFIFLVLFLIGVWGIKAQDIQLSLNYTLSAGVHTSSFDFERLRNVLTSILNTFPYAVFLPTFLLAGLFSRFFKAYFPYLILFLPLLPLAAKGYTSLTFSHGYVFLLSMLYPLLYFLRKKDDAGKILFFSVWFPSFLAALITAYTSSNGYRSAAVGAFPGALITLLYLALILGEEINLKVAFLPLSDFLKSFPLVLVLVFLLFFHLSDVYRDDPLNLLKAKIKSGAFKGLYTSKAKSNYIVELTEDLRRNCSEEETIFFYDRFPGGYLLTRARPLTNTIWVWQIHSYPKAKHEMVMEYFKKVGNPDLVVKIKVLFYSAKKKEKMTYPADYLIDKYFKAQGYKLVVNKENYQIYRPL